MLLNCSTLALEKLYRAFMLLRLFALIECAQIAAFPALGIFLARVESILTRFQFSDHGSASYADNMVYGK